MNKIILPLFALVIVSCDDTQPTEKLQDGTSTALTAVELRDSAVVLAYDAETMSQKEQAVALYDQAIELDPYNKQSYMGKLGIISMMGDNQKLLSNLEEVHGRFPDNPFIALHLGMEYELQETMDKAQPLYGKSLATFLSTIDTMTASSPLIRNSYLMNMAVANVLVVEKKDASEIAEILDADEFENYQITITQIEAMDHDALLNLRRN